MKLNKLHVACTLAMAALSSQALALTAFDAPDATVYLSGASAPQNIMGALGLQMFDAAQGIFEFHDNGGTTATFTDDGRSYRAYFGVVKNDASFPASLRNKKILLINRAKGGSVWGVNPVARGERIATMQVASASCTLNTGIYRCPQVGVDPGLGAQTGQEMTPDFGVSDVEPNLFKGPFNVEFGFTELTPAESAIFAGTQSGVNVLMMGFSATNAVPDNTYFSRSIYGSMLSGMIQDWSQVDAAQSGPVVICRRVQGSGTQASYNWFFNNFPCTTNSIAGTGNTSPARMTNSATYVLNGDAWTGAGTTASPYIINPADGYTVIENPSSGNVRDCLNKAQVGGNHEFTGDDGKRYRVTFGAGGHKAIGVLSLDSSGSENGWKFRTMEGAGTYNGVTNTTTGTGVAPSKDNLRDGRYDFASELSMQYRNANLPAAPANYRPVAVPSLANDPNPLKKLFVDEFIKRAGDPDVLNAITSVGLKNATMALPISFDPTANTNVAKGTRYGNMCSPLQIIY